MLEAYGALIGLVAMPGLWTGAQMPAGSEHACDRAGAVSRGVVAELAGAWLRVDAEERVEPPHPPSSMDATQSSPSVPWRIERHCDCGCDRTAARGSRRAAGHAHTRRAVAR